jgi:hypothetical protein
VAGLSTAVCILVTFLLGKYVVNNRYRELVQTSKEDTQNEEIREDKVRSEIHANNGFTIEESEESNEQTEDIIISKF